MKSFIIKLVKVFGCYTNLKLIKDKYFINPKQKNFNEKLYNFYSGFIKPGNLCFDVGANYGYRTEAFLRLGAKVIAIEPQPNLADFLSRKFKKNIVLIKKALGANNEIKPMMISSAHALSSLSEKWINAVKVDRFKNNTWDQKILVMVTTLDSMIEEFGIPDFCKIDVEGYELEVLQGLTSTIRLLSFEFTIPELMDNAIECINYLGGLGPIKCNYSAGETLSLGLKSWLDPLQFIPIFKDLPNNNIIDGDIYIKFI